MLQIFSGEGLSDFSLCTEGHCQYLGDPLSKAFYIQESMPAGVSRVVTNSVRRKGKKFVTNSVRRYMIASKLKEFDL
jgi:hypothetical protein